MSGSIEMRQVFDVNDAQVRSIVSMSDDYLSALYPAESNHAEPLEQLVGGKAKFFAGYVGEELAACGAVKLVEDESTYGEIKRVFVDEGHRGKGLAIAVMQHLENFLRDRGIKIARLEAGPMQPEALGLYRKLGYSDRGPFGSYQLDPLSVFMEKDLSV